MHKVNLVTITQALVILAYLTLITLSPSIRFISYIDYHDCQRVIQLLLLVFVLIDGIFLTSKKYNLMPFQGGLRIAFFSFLALSVISTFMALAPRQAVIEVTVFVALAYLSLFIARSYCSDKSSLVRYLSYALWASIILYMFSFYVGYTSAMIVRKPLEWPMPFYGFSNIRLFQQYQLWGLGLICLPLLAFELKKNVRNLLYVALSAWWVLLFYAASRGVTLGWVIAMFITAVFYKKQAWPFLRIQLYTAITGLILFLILFYLVPSLQFTPAEAVTTTGTITDSSNPIVFRTVFRDSTSDRLDLWKVAYVMIKNFPILGVGPMHFYFYNSFGTHPHNSILQIASEFGLPATFISLGIIGYSFSCWYKKFNAKKLESTTKLDCNLSIILFFTIVANGAYSLVEGVIVMPISQVLMFTMIGLMIGQYKEGTWLSTAGEANKRKFYFRPIFAAITLVFLVASTMPELVRGLTSYQRYYEPGERAFSMGPNTINPRIWMQQKRVEPDKK